MASDGFSIHFLFHSASLVEDALRHRLTSIGIGPRQARVLDALSRMEPTSQVVLAREFGVGAAAMSTMAARLVEAGHVSREIDPGEARAHLLRLTDSGRAKLADIHDAWRDMDALIVERIGTEAAADLSRTARALRDALGGRAPGETTPSRDLIKERTP